jgi:hypothetical protein
MPQMRLATQRGDSPMSTDDFEKKLERLKSMAEARRKIRLAKALFPR